MTDYRLPFLNAQRVHTGTVPPELSSHRKNRVDDALEWALSREGRENIGLAVLALGSVAAIVLIGRYA